MSVRRPMAVASAIVAMALVASACGTTSEAGFPEDERVSDAHYFEEPQAFRSQLLVHPWIAAIRVGNGRSTFGREIPRVIRIEVDGRGPLQDRDVTLQTPPTVALFDGPGNRRMRELMFGAMSLLDERGGFVRGITLSTSTATYETAALAGIIEQNALDGEFTRADQRYIASLLGLYVRELSEHSLAWFDLRTTWVSLGPRVSNTIRLHARTPARVKPADGIWAAFVIRHEFEHAVTPVSDELYYEIQWIEEGAADTMARWPGAAAETARALGLPYPKRYERTSYEPRDVGYARWAQTLRLLLRAAGIDVTDPDDFDEASALLQQDRTSLVLPSLARAIAAEQGLSPARARSLRRAVVALDGDPRRARPLVAAWL